MAHLGRREVRKLNRLRPLQLLNARRRPQSEQDALWRELLAEAQAAGVLILATRPTGAAHINTERFLHALQTPDGQPITDCLFVRDLYWSGGTQEFCGYFS